MPAGVHLFFAWLAAGPSARADVLEVPDEYPDLAAALEDAEDGDRIEIAAGDWLGLSSTITVDVVIRGAGIGMTHLVMDDDGTGLVVDAAVTIGGLTLSGGEGGRPLEATGGTLTLDGVEVADGSAPDLGGLVTVENDAELIAIGSTFRGGRARFGGAVAFGGGASGSFTDCTFEDNEVSGPGTDGGAVRLAEDAAASFASCAFTGNRSVDHIGGAVALLNGGASATFTDCTFEGNTAGSSGGAIHSFSGNRVTVIGGRFSGGTATENGGAIACGGSVPCVLEVTGAVFDGNTAARGGHVYVESGDAIFGDTELRLGVAGEDGGGIAVEGDGSSLALVDARFEANVAGDDGGAVFVDGVAEVSLVRPWICANTAGDDGGGFYSDHTDGVSITNGTFLANTGAEDGGAVRVHGGTGTITQSTFLGDTSNGGLGAVGYEAPEDALTVTRSVFVDTSSPALNVVGEGPILLSWSAFFPQRPASPQIVETHPVTLGGDPFPGVDPSACPEAVIPLFEGDLVDAGDPTVLDLDGSGSDLGATGGPDADPDLWIDGDDDGVVVMWDCDDGDPGRSPLLPEIPDDGIDQDCDGVDGEPPTDTGAEPPDTGSPTDPGQVAPPPRDDDRPDDVPTVGCGCGSTGGGSWLAALLVLAVRRQRTRSCIPA